MEVDGEERLTVAAELVLREGLAAGDEVSEARLAALERADEAWRAQDSALLLLSHRPRTEAELRRRLGAKGYPPDVVDACLAKLLERGWLDDGEFARAFTRDRIRLRPRGRARLLDELRAKGVARDEADEAVSDVFEAQEVSEAELALRVARAWAKRNLRPRSTAGDRDAALRLRRRLYGHLSRRGFRGEALRSAMAAVLPEA